MTLAHRLADLAARILPPGRETWAEAMRQEVRAVPPGGEALAFAIGCLQAALCERITIMKVVVFTGRLGVALVTALYGLSFLYFLSNGLRSPEPHPYLPWLAGWQTMMGLSHIAAAAFLVFWRPRPFLWSCAAAAIPALGLTLFGFWSQLSGKLSLAASPIAWMWPFVPLILLAAAAALLAWMDRPRLRPARS